MRRESPRYSSGCFSSGFSNAINCGGISFPSPNDSVDESQQHHLPEKVSEFRGIAIAIDRVDLGSRPAEHLEPRQRLEPDVGQIEGPSPAGTVRSAVCSIVDDRKSTL